MGGEGGRLAPLSSEIPIWLPAVENRGEGIFLSIKEKKLKQWEENEKIKKRFQTIHKDRHDQFIDRVLSSQGSRNLSSRYVLLHTLSHLLIREISKFAGYSSSSIRERIYGREGMAGILIYTASSSSDGSLGGLVEQGQRNFEFILRGAITQGRVCSSDPLCALLTPGIGNRRNGSACDACLFLPETSCECMNDLLDRWFIHSTLSSGIGLFATF